jgi:hypothetical protein
MFIRKARAYLSDTPFWSPLMGRLLALPTNIRLGWKGLLRTNTQAYYERLHINPVIARVCTPGKPFQSSLMFLSNARAYLSKEPF